MQMVKVARDAQVHQVGDGDNHNHLQRRKKVSRYPYQSPLEHLFLDELHQTSG